MLWRACLAISQNSQRVRSLEQQRVLKEHKLLCSYSSRCSSWPTALSLSLRMSFLKSHVFCKAKGEEARRERRSLEHYSRAWVSASTLLWKHNTPPTCDWNQLALLMFQIKACCSGKQVLMTMELLTSSDKSVLYLFSDYFFSCSIWKKRTASSLITCSQMVYTLALALSKSSCNFEFSSFR